MFAYRKASERAKWRIVVKITRAERSANKAAREELAAELEARYAKIISRWRTSRRVGDIEAHVATSGTVGLIEGPMKYGQLEADIGAAINDTFRQALDRGRNIGMRFSGLEGIELNPELATQRALGWIDTVGAQRIGGINQSTQGAVRKFLSEQITDVISPTEAATKIGRVVGLDERGINALRKFEERLIRVRIPTPEADTVATRRAIGQEVERYRQRLLRTRGERIAETEVQTAIHQGERQFWDQAVAEGQVEQPELAQKRWYTVADGDVCENCEPLHEVTVGVDDLFNHGLGVSSEPPIHVNCRCYLEYSGTGF